MWKSLYLALNAKLLLKHENSITNVIKNIVQLGLNKIWIINFVLIKDNNIYILLLKQQTNKQDKNIIV